MSQNSADDFSEPLDAVEGLKPLPPMANLDDGPTVVDPADAAAVIRDAALVEETSPGDRELTTIQGRNAEEVIIGRGRGARRAKREAETDERIDEKLQKIFATERDGYLEIERISPRDAPDFELGIIPTPLRWSEIEGSSVNEVIFKKHGGGDYRIVPKRADQSVVDADVAIVKISGAPKFRTEAGRKWWAAAEKSGTTTDPVEALRSGGGETNMFQFIIGFLERDKESQRLAHEAENARRKEEAEERKRDWQEKQAELKQAREKEIAEINARAEKEREQFKARMEQEAALAKQRMDFQLEQMKQDAEDRRARAERQEEEDREERAAARAARERREESRETGGLGFGGIKKIREEISSVLARDILKGAGLNADGEEDEEEGGLAGAFASVIREQGPDLLKMAGQVLLPKLANFLPGPAAEAPAAAPQERAFAPPQPVDSSAGPVATMARTAEIVRSTAAGDPPEEPEDSAPPDQPTTPPAAPSHEIVARMAAGYAVTTSLQFFRPLGPLMLAQPEPQAAWDAPVGDGGRTIEELYAAMPVGSRNAVATNWESFVGAIKEASPEDAQLYADAVKQDGAAKWIEEFLACGPWTDGEDDGA